MNQYYQLNYLSNDFYTHYNSKDFPEIENKQSRPYMVLLIHIGNNTFAVPMYRIIIAINSKHLHVRRTALPDLTIQKPLLSMNRAT